VREAYTGTVAKLIDTTKCIGCKACRSRAWNGTTCATRSASTAGVYDNPGDLSGESWTLMRFTEYENPKGDLEWLIRKDAACTVPTRGA